MSVNELLDTLFEELEASKKSFMSSKKLVDTDKCLDLIDDIRDNLPVELERAGNIIKERRQILADGEKEAQQYIEEAQRQAAQLVSETSIIKQAQQEAHVGTPRNGTVGAAGGRAHSDRGQAKRQGDPSGRQGLCQ